MLIARLLAQGAAPLLWPAPAGDWPLVEQLRGHVEAGLVLHGTRHDDVQHLEATDQTDFYGRRAHGIFATRDPIWPLFYALVDRASAGSLRAPNVNSLLGTRYFFSTQHDPGWAPGWIYLLPGDGFDPLPGTNELVHPGPRVAVAGRIAVVPADFPFLTMVGRHDPADAMLKTLWRLRHRRR